MLSSSFYWASLSASSLTGTTNGTAQSDIKPKAEYGFNIYYQQVLTTNSISAFGGLDYEQFSTFNTDEYATSGAELTFYQNKITYGTMGLGKTFFLGSDRLLLKTSLSQSLHSSTTSAVPNSEFKGQRFLLFASYKGDSRMSYHLLFKRHMLEGSSKLTINRIGVGIGFVIF